MTYKDFYKGKKNKRTIYGIAMLEEKCLKGN